MTPAFRSTALAAALVALSFGAVAAPIEVNFDDVGRDAFNARSPVKLDNPINGFRFSNAWGYRFDMFTDDDVVPRVWNPSVSPATCSASDTACNRTGFIMNRPRTAGAAGLLEISLDPTIYAGQFITSINLNLFHNTRNAEVVALNANRVDATKLVLRGISDGNLSWTNWGTTLANSDFTILQFRFNEAPLGLDNLNITLSAATGGGGSGGGNVPEPASFALVGLALLAAGAARRRKA